MLTRFDALGSQLTLDKMRRELGIGLGWAAGVAAAAALLTACGEPAIEDPTLTLAHLESPLTLSAQLSIEPADGRFQDEDNAALVALATEAGFLQIEPYPGAGPYWRFVARDAEREADTVTFPAAHREVSRRTDWRLMEEGERAQVQSETIDYMLRFDDRFNAPRELGPFTVRMVVARASRSAQWRVRAREYPNHDPREEGALLRALAIELGRPLLPTLAARIEAAQQAAYAAIEEDLLRSGRIARGDVPHTLVIPAMGLMFWTQANPPDGLNREGAIALCANARVERAGRRAEQAYDDWRLPSRAEFAAALDGDSFVDTPDRRLWGEIARPPSAGRVVPFFIREGEYLLHPTGEILRPQPIDPHAEDAPPPPRRVSARVLCVRSAG